MIGVVIINFGNPERTIRFVREECVKIGAQHQVVIVDNGSGEDAVEILKKALDCMEEEMKHPEDSLSMALYEYAETVNTDVMEQLSRNAEDKWRKLIRYGIKRGEFQNVNVDEIVNVILYSYQGIRMWSRIISMKPKTFRSITDHIRKQLTGGER
jgi:GT2 family glycosyltransferase